MRFSSQKFRSWFGPMPGRREARAMSLMALVVGFILCGLSLFRGFHGQTFMGRPLGGDFVEFYVIGKILNSYEAFRIYDLQLAVALQHATLPTMVETQMLVFGHAPYVAYLFRPFAALPYAWAYISWLVFSASLYLMSLFLLFRSDNLPREDKKTGLMLAISSVPFILETWIGGQLSVVVFFAWALFFYFRHKNRLFLAGIALALGSFKPTLVVLPAAMLLCGRQWRILGGLATGALAFVLASIRMVGLRGCRAWMDTLLSDARIAVGPEEVRLVAKCVDIASFFHLLVRNAPVLTGILASVIGVAVFAMLAIAWYRSAACASRPSENLLWAATVCFTLVVNSYAPIYDSILAVSAVVLVADALDRRSEDRETFQAWLVALYIVPWITQSAAEFLHFQLFTIVLAGFAFWALRLATREQETLQTEAAEVLTIQ
jgi:hypothetical protein